MKTLFRIFAQFKIAKYNNKYMKLSISYNYRNSFEVKLIIIAFHYYLTIIVKCTSYNDEQYHQGN